MRFHLTAAENHETGELGWKDKRIAFNSPYGPTADSMQLAHDCLEHFALQEISDEIMAHGAIYWGRYQGGYTLWNGRGIKLSDLGSDWIGLYNACEEFPVHNPGRTTRLDDEVEEDISTIVEEARRYLVGEHGVDFNRQRFEMLAKAFRGWFRKGYRKAEKRWRARGMTPAEVSHTFTILEGKFQKNRPEFEGQELVVKVTKKGDVLMFQPELELY